MIQQVVKQWELGKADLRKSFEAKLPENYQEGYLDILNRIFETCFKQTYAYNEIVLDKEKIRVIDDGNHSGSLLFIFPSELYSPSVQDYLYTSVNYGSCTGCDTLQRILSNLEDNSNLEEVKKEIDNLMTVSLHLVQNMKYLENSN